MGHPIHDKLRLKPRSSYSMESQGSNSSYSMESQGSNSSYSMESQGISGSHLPEAIQRMLFVTTFDGRIATIDPSRVEAMPLESEMFEDYRDPRVVNHIVDIETDDEVVVLCFSVIGPFITNIDRWE